MYTLLIVDDEQFERNVIKFLASGFKLNLNLCEAENGKKALEYIMLNHVDILLTDIKMPFMDGLDLADQAKKLNPCLKIIIFSAYGEFDYAKKAIENNVMNYLLKPLDPDEFFAVMTKVIKNCSDEENKQKEAKRLLEGYNKNLIYEKEKLLTDLINGIEIDEDFLQQLSLTGINLECDNSVMLLVYLEKNFFGSKNDEFINILNKELKAEFEYLNLNEYQSILFLKNTSVQTDKGMLDDIGETIKHIIYKNFNIKSFLIFSNTIKGIQEYKEEYKNIESMTDLKFFFDDSIILFSNDSFPKYTNITESIDKTLEKIYIAFNAGDSINAIKEIEQLFYMFKSEKSISSMYVKYYCVEILKLLNKTLAKKDNGDFNLLLEKVFSEVNLNKLKDFIINMIADLGENKQTSSNETVRNVISSVFKIIDEEYFNDLGLDYIASKVYLAPTYLSYLFKKETGQTVLKYITSYRLKKAMELLKDTNMRIVDICNKVGYEKLSYFCMLFKNNFGVTPAKYREERK